MTITAFNAARRQFVAASTLAALSAAPWGRRLLAQDAAKVTADKFIAGKHRQLIVHSTKTGELETPLTLLREHRITPASILFVRNNQVTSDGLSLEPAKDTDDWKIKIDGDVAKPREIRVADLQKLPQRDVEMVLQCSGNGRASFGKAAPVSGSPWTGGAMGNVVFGGVMLADALKHAGVTIDPQAKFLTAEGQDDSPKPDVDDFEHSMPLETTLSRSLLVLTLNGESLPKVHGGPVRLATPGFYGTMQVKWLSKLRFMAAESTTHHHVERYRTPLVPIEPGTEWQSTLANSEANWNMKVKSTIFSPLASDTVRAGRVEVTGVAWNDGQAKIDAVEVSTDGGNIWRRAALARTASPYAWHPWKIAVMLRPGKQTILSRAVDALGRAQPRDGSIAWNPAGYTWNGVDEVELNVE
jgi:DMSO/TMAO reductase YedYZ molybdopterin-dependent catalytic subunit